MRRTGVRSALDGAGQGLLASTIGLIGLPIVFANVPDLGGVRAWLWLAMAVGVSAWLCILAPVVARFLALLLAQVPAPSRQADLLSRTSVEVARLTVAVGYLVLVQAIIRRPLVASIGHGADVFSVEATFAAAALITLFFLLSWLYQAARTIVEGVVAVALDSVLATSDTETTTTPVTHVPAVTRLASAHPATIAADSQQTTVRLDDQ